MTLTPKTEPQLLEPVAVLGQGRPRAIGRWRPPTVAGCLPCRPRSPPPPPAARPALRSTTAQSPPRPGWRRTTRCGQLPNDGGQSNRIKSYRSATPFSAAAGGAPGPPAGTARCSRARSAGITSTSSPHPVAVMASRPTLSVRRTTRPRWCSRRRRHSARRWRWPAGRGPRSAPGVVRCGPHWPRPRVTVVLPTPFEAQHRDHRGIHPTLCH